MRELLGHVAGVLNGDAKRHGWATVGQLSIVRHGAAGDDRFVHGLGQLTLVEVTRGSVYTGQVRLAGGVIADGRKQPLIDQVLRAAGGHQDIGHLAKAPSVEPRGRGGEVQKVCTAWARVFGASASPLENLLVGVGHGQVRLIHDDQVGRLVPVQAAHQGLHHGHLHGQAVVAVATRGDPAVRDFFVLELLAGGRQDFLEVGNEPDALAFGQGASNDCGACMGFAKTGGGNQHRRTVAALVRRGDVLDGLVLSGAQVTVHA